MSFYFDRFYGPSTPIKAKGGIKAQTQRGEFGKSWWAKRWIAILESFDLGGRLSRGRSYARKGQVTALEVGKGSVNAKVQGSMPKPYKVKIELDPLSAKEWKKVLEKLSGQALFTAKLLAGAILASDLVSMLVRLRARAMPRPSRSQLNHARLPCRSIDQSEYRRSGGHGASAGRRARHARYGREAGNPRLPRARTAVTLAWRAAY